MAIQLVTNQIANLAITTAKIDNLAVTRGKLENGNAGNASYGINETKLIGAAVASRTALSLSNLIADQKYVDDISAAGVYWREPVETKMIAGDKAVAVECIGNSVVAYNMKSDVAQAGSPPAGVTGDAWIADTWGVPYLDGHIYEYDGASWVDLGVPVQGTQVIVSATGVGGTFTEQEKAIGQYHTIAGLGWDFFAQNSPTSAVIGRISGSPNASGKVDHVMEYHVPATPGPTTWEDIKTLANHDVIVPIGPASTLDRGLISDYTKAYEADGAEDFNASPYTGQAHQVTNTNSNAHLHIYEYNSDTGVDEFVDLDSYHAGGTPANAHVIVDYHLPPGWTGSMVGHENEVGLWNGSAWSFTAMTDGEAHLCIGDGSEFEACGFVWNADLGGLVQFAGASNITAGLGLYKSGASLNVGEKVGGAIKVEAQQIGLNIDDGVPADRRGLWIDETVPGEGKLKVRIGENETPSIPSGLEFTGSYGALRVKCRTNGGLDLDVNGAGIKLSAAVLASGLALDSNGLKLNPFTQQFSASGGATEDFALTHAPFAEDAMMFCFRNTAAQVHTSGTPGAGQYKITSGTPKITVGETVVGDSVVVQYFW